MEYNAMGATVYYTSVPKYHTNLFAPVTFPQSV